MSYFRVDSERREEVAMSYFSIHNHTEYSNLRLL